MSIHIRTTSGYSDGLMNPSYENLIYDLGFQASLGSGGSSGSFCCTCSSKMVVVKKIETHVGKLVSELSFIFPNKVSDGSAKINRKQKTPF